ncbi:MAG: STAS domain-containing protein [Acidobacteriia bacterium]|nr:STAS domain-containing protein [Terriglobia bacterium]
MSDPARLSLQIHGEGDEAMVRCSGKLVAGVTETLVDETRPLIKSYRRVVLDLSDLTQMDSMGLGAIVRLLVSARSAGCSLELINLSKRVRELFGITHLLSAFEACGEQRHRLP